MPIPNVSVYIELGQRCNDRQNKQFETVAPRQTFGGPFKQELALGL